MKLKECFTSKVTILAFKDSKQTNFCHHLIKDFVFNLYFDPGFMIVNFGSSLYWYLILYPTILSHSKKFLRNFRLHNQRCIYRACSSQNQTHISQSLSNLVRLCTQESLLLLICQSLWWHTCERSQWLSNGVSWSRFATTAQIIDSVLWLAGCLSLGWVSWQRLRVFDIARDVSWRIWVSCSNSTTWSWDSKRRGTSNSWTWTTLYSPLVF